MSGGRDGGGVVRRPRAAVVVVIPALHCRVFSVQEDEAGALAGSDERRDLLGVVVDCYVQKRQKEFTVEAPACEYSLRRHLGCEVGSSNNSTDLTTKEMAKGVVIRKHLNRDLLSSLLAEADNKDALKVRPLVAPVADASLALLERKFSVMGGRDGKRSSGMRATSSTAANAIAKQEGSSRRRIMELWKDLVQVKARLYRIRGGGTPSGAGGNELTMLRLSQLPPHAGHAGTVDNTPSRLAPMFLE